MGGLGSECAATLVLVRSRRQNPLLVQAGRGGGVRLQRAARLPLHGGGARTCARKRPRKFLAAISYAPAALGMEGRLVAPA